MKQLEKRVALITGGSRGIGHAIAQAFAAEGATVLITSRKADEVEAAAQALRADGGDVVGIEADVSREADVDRVFAHLMDRHGRLDILVNNAGVTRGGPTEGLALDAWQHVMDVNVTGAFLCARAAFKVMKPQQSGRIINIGSIARQTPRPNGAAYSVSKSAVAGLTHSLALDGREHGIAVSIVHLGEAATTFSGGRRAEAAAPAFRALEPAEAARVVLLMAALPADVNLYEATLLPLTQPSFIGRG